MPILAAFSIIKDTKKRQSANTRRGRNKQKTENGQVQDNEGSGIKTKKVADSLSATLNHILCC